jgi:hypothetical protein
MGNPAPTISRQLAALAITRHLVGRAAPVDLSAISVGAPGPSSPGALNLTTSQPGAVVAPGRMTYGPGHAGLSDPHWRPGSGPVPRVVPILDVGGTWTPVTGIFAVNSLYTQPEKLCWAQFWDVRSPVAARFNDRLALVVVIPGETIGDLTMAQSSPAFAPVAGVATRDVFGGMLALWCALGFRVGSPDMGLPLNSGYVPGAVGVEHQELVQRGSVIRVGTVKVPEYQWRSRQDFSGGYMAWTVPGHLWAYQKQGKDFSRFYENNGPPETWIPQEMIGLVITALGTIAGAALQLIPGLGTIAGIAVAGGSRAAGQAYDAAHQETAPGAAASSWSDAQQEALLRAGVGWRVADVIAQVAPVRPGASLLAPDGDPTLPDHPLDPALLAALAVAAAVVR